MESDWLSVISLASCLALCIGTVVYTIVMSERDYQRIRGDAEKVREDADRILQETEKVRGDADRLREENRILIETNASTQVSLSIASFELLRLKKMLCPRGAFELYESLFNPPPSFNAPTRALQWRWRYYNRPDLRNELLALAPLYNKVVDGNSIGRTAAGIYAIFSQHVHNTCDGTEVILDGGVHTAEEIMLMKAINKDRPLRLTVINDKII